MSSALSAIFWVFTGVVITASVIIAIYMVLGLLLVKHLGESDSEYKALQVQTQFLVDGASNPVKYDLEQSGVFGVFRSFSKQSFPFGCKTNAAGVEANKQQTTSKVYGAALQ